MAVRAAMRRAPLSTTTDTTAMTQTTDTTVIFQARKIITMNPMQPEATHVAVRDGRVLGVGSADELAG